MTKRNLFDELTAGFDALAAERQGKLTLRKLKVKASLKPLEITPSEIKQVRHAVGASQTVMAMSLRVNPRTYQSWEQGAVKPNAQAAVLIKLVEKDPKILEQLAVLA